MLALLLTFCVTLNKSVSKDSLYECMYVLAHLLFCKYSNACYVPGTMLDSEEKTMNQAEIVTS